MRSRRVLVAGGLSAAVTAACALRAGGRSSEPPIHPIPIILSAYPLVFAPVLVDGQPAQALLDTGSSAAVRISTRLAQRVQLDLSPIPGAFAQGLDGQRVAIQRGRLARLELGDFAAGPVAVEVADRRIESISAQVGTAFDAVLGWSFLANYHFVLDYKTRQLQISERRIPPTAVTSAAFAFPFVVVQRLPLIAADLERQSVQLLLDTGAPMCNLDSAFCSEPAGEIVTRTLLLAAVQLQVQWRVKDLGPQRRALGTVGTIGNNFLRTYALHVNPQEQTIRLA